MTANYALQSMVASLGGVMIAVQQGATRDTVTDAAVIVLWPSNFTATPPARGSIPNALFDYLQAHPRGA
jgi:hypothetical protein